MQLTRHDIGGDVHTVTYYPIKKVTGFKFQLRPELRLVIWETNGKTLGKDVVTTEQQAERIEKLQTFHHYQVTDTRERCPQIVWLHLSSKQPLR